MIDKLTYDEVMNISQDLKNQIIVVDQIVRERGIEDLADFIATVEGYSKYLENTVEINKDADKALSALKSQVK